MTRLGLCVIACLLVAVKSASAQQPPSRRSFHDRYADLVANPRRLSDSTRLGELFRVNWEYLMTEFPEFATYVEIGRASCRERVKIWGCAAALKSKRTACVPL